MKGRKPNLSHLKVFGCVCYARTETVGRKKLDDRSRALVHLGTEPGSKAYRLFDPLSSRVVISRDVVFEERMQWRWNDKNVTKKLDNGEFELSLRSLGHYDNDVGEDVEVLDDGNDGENHDEDNGENLDVDDIPLRRSTRVSNKPPYLEDYILLAEVESEQLLMIINDEPWNFNDAKELKVWIDACKDEISSIEKNITWDLVELPAGIKPIGLKWVFKIKRNVDGSISKYKARLVAKGYVQRHGMDYDEVFALVARIETLQMIIALAGSHGWDIHHLDVKTTFLHGELKEEVYVTQPEGFIVAGQEHKVYKLKKALYGLRQAPRAWNIKLNEILRSPRFQRCSKEPSLYRKEESREILIVVVYVDDLLVTGSSIEAILEFKREMATKFEMSELGKLTYYLGIEVKQYEGGIILKQDRYPQKILEETGMNSCNLTHVPLELNAMFSKAPNEGRLMQKNIVEALDVYVTYYIRDRIYLLVLEF